MKTENTLDKKVKFLSQYWGLDVLNFYGKLIAVHHAIDEKYIGDSFLQLKPLESISDEDCLSIAKIINLAHLSPKETLVDLVKDILIKRRNNGKVYLWLNIFDYLRSKGYAIPFMDLSVQDLIDYGWIKLTES